MQPFKLDYMLLCIFIPILGFGTAMIFSASSYLGLKDYGNINFFLTKQLINIALGFVALYVCVRIPYQFLGRNIKFIYIGVLILQFLVFVSAFTKSVNGAGRWVTIAGFSFQPSEFAKLALIITLALMISKLGERGINHLQKGMIPLLMIIALYVITVLMQKHLSAAMVLAGISFIMLVVGGLAMRYIVGMGVLGASLLGIGIAMEPFRWKRITGFLNPEADPLGQGYHIIQSWYALGSGKWMGLGLGMSREKFTWLPENHTDFILGIIGEETGFIGITAVILLYVLFMFRSLAIARNAPDNFGRFIVIGVTALFFLQVFINIAVVSGFFPVTGMVLPFISYGGSSTIVLFAAVGLIFNVASQIKNEE